MKRKIDWIFKILVILMTIGLLVIVKKDISNKYTFYYAIFYCIFFAISTIYMILTAIINVIRVSKAQKSLKWIGFKDLILSFFRNLIILFILVVAFKYIIKHDTNIVGIFWSCIGTTISMTIGEFIYKIRNQKVKHI